jgi:secreted Zn-dependent insulinase-like peptidase
MNTAGYSASNLVSVDHYTLYVRGRHNNVVNVFEYMLNKISNIDINEYSLENVKKIRKDNLVNFKFMAPYEKLTSYLQDELNPISFRARYLDIIDTISVNDVMLTVKEILSNASARVLIAGNVNDDIKRDVLDIISLNLKPNRFDINNNYLDMKLDDNKMIIREAMINTEQNSAFSMNYYIMNMGTDVNWRKILAISEIITQILETDYYHEMRTTRKLGYIVKCRDMYLSTGHLHLCKTLQFSHRLRVQMN